MITEVRPRINSEILSNIIIGRIFLQFRFKLIKLHN